MKKTAAILSLCLGLFLLTTCIYMVREDGLTAADRITRSFNSIGDSSALDRMAHERESRDNEEKMYGLVGIVAVIAGFALWPREVSTTPAT